jgi:hypothetical protein
MATGYIMLDHPNVDWPQGTYPRRGVRGKLTGTAILHTSEGDWRRGVQALTDLVQTRASYGCYHQACDWEDIAQYYPWEWETWQDTETNNWAVGIAAACRTSDWKVMPAEIREGFLRNMGRMAADFVRYMKSQYGITVPLKRITGEQARAGVPGFCAHGDSGIARTDPGADFDWAAFFKYAQEALGGSPATPTPKKDGFDMATLKDLVSAVLKVWAYKGTGESRDAYQILRDVPEDIWDRSYVKRGGKLIPVKQELADAVTLGERNEKKLDAIIAHLGIQDPTKKGA